jgi:hypothetical protein
MAGRPAGAEAPGAASAGESHAEDASLGQDGHRRLHRLGEWRIGGASLLLSVEIFILGNSRN